jgi:hypothetical protein
MDATLESSKVGFKSMSYGLWRHVSVAVGYHRFRGPCCLHLHPRRWRLESLSPWNSQILSELGISKAHHRCDLEWQYRSMIIIQLGRFQQSLGMDSHARTHTQTAQIILHFGHRKSSVVISVSGTAKHWEFTHKKKQQRTAKFICIRWAVSRVRIY